MKKAIRKVIWQFGWDLHRLTSANDPSRQLVAALNYSNSTLVFDVGANVGQFAQEIRYGGFEGRIVSFEPLSRAHGELCENASGDSNWLVHSRAAVGDREGEVDIYIAGNSVSSSLLPMLDSHVSVATDSAYISSERTPLVKLDSVASQYIDHSSRPFIKIDTQGFEWQVLDGAADTVASATGVLLELSLVTLYEGQRLWRDFVDRMEGEGFTLWAIQRGFTDPANGRSLQMNAIFLRE